MRGACTFQRRKISHVPSLIVLMDNIEPATGPNGVGLPHHATNDYDRRPKVNGTCVPKVTNLKILYAYFYVKYITLHRIEVESCQ